MEEVRFSPPEFIFLNHSETLLWLRGRVLPPGGGAYIYISTLSFFYPVLFLGDIMDKTTLATEVAAVTTLPEEFSTTIIDLVGSTTESIYLMIDKYSSEKYHRQLEEYPCDLSKDFSSQEDISEIVKLINAEFDINLLDNPDIDPVCLMVYSGDIDGYTDEDYSEILLEFISKNLELVEDQVKVLSSSDSSQEAKLLAFFVLITKVFSNGFSAPPVDVYCIFIDQD